MPAPHQPDRHPHARADRPGARGLLQDRQGTGGHLTDVVVRRVNTPGDLQQFIDLPYRLHARDPYWVPPLRMEVATLLDRAKNPYFAHGAADYFLAERGGRVVGRIAAISNQLHNEIHEDRVGFFGFFECEDDQEAADALFAEAERWVRARGLDTLRGPSSFSVNEECGLLVDGFRTPNVVMMPHNPPYYQRLIEQAGFTKAKDLLAYEGGNAAHPVPAPERLVRAVELTLQRYGITLRSLDMSRFKDEVDTIKRLYNKAWEKNWGFVPMTDAEIDKLARDFKPVIMPEMVIFAERQGEPVGFGLAIPDLNEALRTNRNGGIVKGALAILWWKFRKKFTRARVPLLGVIPEFRGRGLDSALYHHVWSRAGSQGIGWGEGGWILEDNPAMKLGLEKMGFVVYKTYRMYDRAVKA